MVVSPLKWVGGKGRITDFILNHVPKSFSNYYEPFLGSGAVFLAMKQTVGGSRDWYISDTNPHLICWWKTVQSDVAGLLEELFHIQNTYETGDRKENYRILRAEFNNQVELDTRKAALFMFLCRIAFNGLVRYNSKGGFNSAWGNQLTGKHKNAFVIDKDNLISLSEILDSGVYIMNSSYENIGCKLGDLVFCDPPYVAINDRKIDSLSYSKDGFNTEDQLKFANWCSDNFSSYLMICNHDTDFIRECFKTFQFTSYDLMKSFSGVGSARKKTTEVLITNTCLM
jgi:DNA adenine methylase